MAKRQYDSSEASQTGSGESPEDVKPALKRSRVERADEAADASSPSLMDLSADHNMSGAVPLEDDSDDEDDFHQEEEQQMMARSSKTVAGEVAQAGVVKSIECINFMCHKRLTVNFGPQINFVIGHNGSGKSAFLTALTIALGGKASTTGRATGLKDFVRTAEGVTQAQIILKLRNKGPDAWQPHKYGDTIVITRTIQREGGGGGTKLSSASGKLVASTRGELQAICDHFNISVDNPINILSQDAARQFLTDSTPQKKYQLFLKGTLLSQLSEDYEKLQNSKHAIQKALGSNMEALLELKKEQKAASKKWEAASTVAEKAGELEKLEAMRAWAVVKNHERAFEDVGTRIAEIQSSIEATETDIEEKEKLALRANRELEEIRKQITAAESEDAVIMHDLNTLSNQIKDNTNKMKRFNEEKRSIKQEVERLRIEMDTYDAQIDEHKAKEAADIAQPRLELLERIQAARAAAETADSEARRAEDEINQKTQEVNELRRSQQQARDEHQRAQESVNRAKASLDSAQAARNNPMQAYGQGVPNLLRQIDSESWVGSKPIGPIGRFVKVKEQQWCQTLETVMGPILNGFIISDNRDKPKLFNLMSKYNLRGVRVYMARDDPTFDPSSGEPDSAFRTIYRILQINNNQVKCCLVNEAHIESSILVDSRREGNQIMYQRPRNVRTAYSIDAFQLGGAGMRRQEIALRKYEGPPRLGADATAHIARCQEALDHCQRMSQEAATRLQRAQAAVSACLQAKSIAASKKDAAYRDASAQRRAIDSLQEEVQKLEPASVAHLEEGRRETERLLEDSARAYADANAQLTEASALNAPLIERRNALQAQLDNGHASRSERSEREAAALRRKMQAESDIEQRKSSLGRKRADLAAHQAAVPNMSEAVDESFQHATSLWADPSEFDELDKVEKYDAQIRQIKKSIKENERRAGMSLEELRLQVANINAAYEKNRQGVEDLKRLFQAIEKSFNERSARWNSFTQQIAIRAKMNFIRLMAGRNFNGRLKFNHTYQRLEILVETQEATAAVNDRRKREAKNLSGGEKSFSTVSFLLTLWESVGCPIRGLDEFDVFQDDEHRTASIKMLVDAAKSSNAKQYLFITPNPIVQQGPHIRIHRLSDPVRDQGTL